MSIGIDKLAHMNIPALSDILLAHSAAEGTGVVAIGDLPKLLNAGNLKMPDSEETIAEHYRYMSGTQILINADFRNPINQRNQLKYTSTEYAIDMWRLNTFGDGFAELLPGVGIRLKSGPKATSAAGFNQQFEANLLGCIATLSALDTQNRLLTATSSILTDSSGWQVSKSQTDFGWLGLRYNVNNVFEFAITSLDNTIVAAKLELGPFQTLAHKEGSKWVPNDPPPDYATELAKCQRYLRVFESLPNGYITANSKIFVSYIPALSGMRGNPAVVLENLSIALRLPSGYSPIASFEEPLQIIDNGYVSSTRFTFTSNETLGENNVPASVEFRSGRIIFSSEL